MVSKRPSIYIYVKNPSSSVLKEICSGIEEEGVFFEIVQRQETKTEELCFRAATDSMLGSGIGITEMEAGLQIKGLPMGKYIFFHQNPTSQEARRLGMNAARAVKKQPFKEE